MSAVTLLTHTHIHTTAELRIEIQLSVHTGMNEGVLYFVGCSIYFKFQTQMGPRFDP